METKDKKTVVAQGAGTEKNNVRELGKNLPMVQPNSAVVLAQTIKTVTDLHTKIRHLDKIEAYTDELEKFKVKKVEENLDGNGSYYAGCKMELRDDDNRIFTLKHPVVIKEVIEFVLGRFNARKTELETQIKLPNKAA